MAIRAFITPQDLVDAISETTYMAIFDDQSTGSRSVVDASMPVQSILARAHAQCMSFLPRIYGTLPPEVPSGIVAGGDSIPVLIKDAEVQWATIYTYRRHPEYVRTYGAEPNGAMTKEVVDMLERLADLVQQVAPTDSPPQPRPGLVQSVVTGLGPRLVSPNDDGSSNLGDF